VGIEWTNYARLAPWLTVDADLGFTRARFTDDDSSGTHIPGALDRVISAALTVEPTKPIFGSLRVRHFGPRPLIEDASVTSKSTTIWNGEAGYRVSLSRTYAQCIGNTEFSRPGAMVPGSQLERFAPALSA
jgi:hypothetical protein